MKTVELTQADIDKGQRRVCWDCPVALAYSRAAGQPIEVGNGTWAFKNGQSNPLPLVAINWVTAFDDKVPCKPITFDDPNL